MFIHNVVSRGARLHPQRTALKTGSDRVTYRQLDTFSDDLAKAICENGWRGANGGVYLNNSIEYAVAFFAIAKASGVAAPTATSAPAARLSGDFEFSDVRYVVTQAKHFERVRDAARQTSNVEALIVVDRGGRSLRVEKISDSPAMRLNPSASAAPQDVVSLVATSGTAAEPKRVMLSHRNLMANVASFLSMANLSPVNKALILLPLTSIGTTTTELLAYLAAGMTMRLYTDVFVLGEFCRMVDEERIQVVNLTPFVLNVMLSKKHEVAQRLRSVKKIFFASAPIPSSQFEELLQVFPRVEFFYGYGQTEASPRCTTLTPKHQPAKLGSSGMALSGVEINIVDEQGGRLPSGQQGEVAVRGPNVMRGYYKRADLTANVIKDGWLHTGDCGFLDEDGFLFIRGRKKNIVVTRGISVNPEEIEQEIAAHPAVREAFVSARVDERVGEQLIAAVVLRDSKSLSELDLKSFLRERLEAAKIPTQIAFVSELHRNHHNKLVRASAPI